MGLVLRALLCPIGGLLVLRALLCYCREESAWTYAATKSSSHELSDAVRDGLEERGGEEKLPPPGAVASPPVGAEASQRGGELLPATTARGCRQPATPAARRPAPAHGSG